MTTSLNELKRRKVKMFLYAIPFLFFGIVTIAWLYDAITALPYIESVKKIGCGGNVGDCISYGAMIVFSPVCAIFFGVSLFWRNIRNNKALFYVLIGLIIIDIFLCFFGSYAMPAN